MEVEVNAQTVSYFTLETTATVSTYKNAVWNNSSDPTDITFVLLNPSPHCYFLSWQAIIRPQVFHPPDFLLCCMLRVTHASSCWPGKTNSWSQTGLSEQSKPDFSELALWNSWLNLPAQILLSALQITSDEMSSIQNFPCVGAHTDFHEP